MALMDNIQSNANMLNLGSNESAIKRLQLAGQGEAQSAAQEGPARETSVAETIAKQGVQQEQRALGTEVLQKEQQLGQQQQALEQDKESERIQLSEQQLNMRQQMQQKVRNLLQTARAKKDTLNLNKQKSLSEQASFLLRLGTEKYTSQLKAEGARSRLDNDLRFQEEALRASFNNARELMDSDVSFRRMLLADDAKFQKELMNMKFEDALKLLDVELKNKLELGQRDIKLGKDVAALQAAANNTQQLISGLQQLPGVAMQAYSAYTSMSNADLRKNLVQSGWATKDEAAGMSRSDLLSNWSAVEGLNKYTPTEIDTTPIGGDWEGLKYGQ